MAPVLMRLNHAQGDMCISYWKLNENWYKRIEKEKKMPQLLQGCILTQFIHSFNQKVLEVSYMSGTVPYTGRAEVHKT